MGAGLFGFSVAEQASGVAICPPHPPSRELLPMNLMSNPLKTPEIYATEPFPSSPFIPHASPTDSAQPALLYALEQHAQVEMGRPRSNRRIIDAANSTAEERQQAQQAPSVVQSSNDASDAVSDVRASFNQISTAQYAPALPTQVQSDGSFHTRGSSASIATEQRRLNSPGAPTSDSHDGCNAQASCELEVTRPKGDWYKKLPEDLIACLEKYQQDNNLSLGIDGLRIQPGYYVCPFCIESKRKLYKRPSHFSNHLASHWAALKKKQ
ncbi:hypothetical protein RAB80_017203 [Fusarium oxysporum f. sp. vasinfectum]|nr:hypothetical protein RAB80_017203 [Fusarium oxysporum f. sp. vasinfectum]